MKPTNKKLIKILTFIVALLGIIILILSYLSNKFFDYRFPDMLLAPIELQTTIENEKALGVKTAKISRAEKKELESMINKSVKAQLEYYSTEKEESLEKVKDLYLPDGFEEYKKDAKRKLAYFYDTRSEKQSYEKMGQLKFSKPRTYRDLPGRIGVISFAKFIDNHGNTYSTLNPIFIFKKINDEWKIEKQTRISSPKEMTEKSLIQKIKNRE